MSASATQAGGDWAGGKATAPSAPRVGRTTARWSIRARLLALLLVPLTCVAVLVAVETYFSARRTASALYDRTLLTVLLAVRENVVASNGEVVTEDVLEVLTENLGDQFFYHVAWPANRFMTGYANRPLPPPNAVVGGGAPLFYDAVYAGDPARAVRLRQFAAEGTPAAANARSDGWLTLTVWQRVRQRDKLAFDLFARSLLRLLGITGAAGLIVFFAVTRGLRPLDALRAALERRSPTELSPIRRPVPPELTGIVRAMNDLLERVERSRANRERFIADAAHQLRNPLAAIKAQAQAGVASGDPDRASNALAAIERTTTHTAGMVEQMLLGARANAARIDRRGEGSRLDPVRIAREATAGLAAKAITAGHRLSFEDRVADGAVVAGDGRLLREAVANLVDNAVVHNEPGTAITVRVATSADGIAIDVIDDGRPMSHADFVRYSQPFATGTRRTEGSGLGLSIAKDIARAHGGQLGVGEGEGGKSLRLVLPTAGP